MHVWEDYQLWQGTLQPQDQRAASGSELAYDTHIVGQTQLEPVWASESKGQSGYEPFWEETALSMAGAAPKTARVRDTGLPDWLEFAHGLP